MTHEKTFFLGTGRCIKILILYSGSMDTTKIEVDVLVKDPRDTDFHPPIGVCHPKYWKLKSIDAQKARRLQIRYSGLTNRHINQVMKEFRQILTDKEQAVLK